MVKDSPPIVAEEPGDEDFYKSASPPPARQLDGLQPASTVEEALVEKPVEKDPVEKEDSEKAVNAAIPALVTGVFASKPALRKISTSVSFPLSFHNTQPAL